MLHDLRYAARVLDVRDRGAGAGVGRAVGIASYSIAQRTREIGVRMALGTRPSTVVPLVALRAD